MDESHLEARVRELEAELRSIAERQREACAVRAFAATQKTSVALHVRSTPLVTDEP